MQTTLLPVDRLLSLATLTEGLLRHQHGCYNMGLAARPQGGYFGIFRNCTRNARHLLGLPMMGEGQYDNRLYGIQITANFNLEHVAEIAGSGNVHDVRVCRTGMIGCVKSAEDVFNPAEIELAAVAHGSRTGFKIQSYCILSNTPQKNWNYLPGNWFDCGWKDNVGMVRAERTTQGRLEETVATNGHPRFCGSAPYFMIGERMITTYHRWVPNEQGKRNYFHYFAELNPRPPYQVLRHSGPFKIGRGGDAGRIQFLMACFPMPGNPRKCLISYGEADADNTVATINTADVLGLLL